MGGHDRRPCEVASVKQGNSQSCGKCDDHVLKAIAAFNVSQDVRVFGQLACACQRDWKDQLEMEAMFQGVYPDPREKWAGTLGVRT